MALEFHSTGLSDTLVILGAAGLVIPTFARFRISPVIGFILVGLAVGPSGLGAMVDRYPWLYHVTISNPEAFEPFAEFGIILLLFSIGLELSFRRLWAMRKLVFGVGATELLASAILIGGTMHFMGASTAASVGIGLALSLSSTALVLPMVGTRSPVGQAAFSMLLFEDLALVPIIFLLGAMAPGASGDTLAPLMATLLVGGLTVVAMLIAGRFVLPLIFAQAARTKSPEVFLAASLLVVIVASLLTALSGLSPIVGALLAGLLIAETDYCGEVEVMTEPFKGMALGVFLLTVGMSLDLSVIAQQWPALLSAVIGVIVAKMVVTALLLRLYGVGRGVSAEVGVLMASPSETTLIVLATAATARLIDPATAAFWQIATAIGLTLTPLLARIGHDVARRIELASSEERTPAVDSNDSKGCTVVIGFGRVGKLVSALLHRNGQSFIAVESNPDIVAESRREGYPLLFGDVTRPDTLKRLPLDKARALILTMDDPVLSVKITRQVRARDADIPIIVRARDTIHAGQLYMAGATAAVPEALESSLQLAETALVELGVGMEHVVSSIHQTREELRDTIKRTANHATIPHIAPAPE